MLVLDEEEAEEENENGHQVSVQESVIPVQVLLNYSTSISGTIEMVVFLVRK